MSEFKECKNISCNKAKNILEDDFYDYSVSFDTATKAVIVAEKEMKGRCIEAYRQLCPDLLNNNKCNLTLVKLTCLKCDCKCEYIKKFKKIIKKNNHV